MTRTLVPGRIAIAVLAVLITAAGAPLALCAAMPACPAMAPPPSCHGAGAEHCAPANLEAHHDCCAASAEQGVPPAAVEKLAGGGGAGLPVVATAVQPVPAPAVGSRGSLGARPLAPSGRALLSLHHTLLI